jgi:hypothetical protein
VRPQPSKSHRESQESHLLLPVVVVLKKSNYVGTEVGGAWWKRYRGTGFFSRGNGEFTLDESGITFRKLLTKTPLEIRWDEMTGADLGRRHAGRYLGGHPILEVGFARHHQDLTADFYLSAEWPQTEDLVADLQRRITGS